MKTQSQKTKMLGSIIRHLVDLDRLRHTRTNLAAGNQRACGNRRTGGDQRYGSNRRARRDPRRAASNVSSGAIASD